MSRVLVSEFDTIVGLGVCEVLREGGCEVVTRCGSLTPELVRSVAPNALVIDMDDERTVTDARVLRAHFPGIAFVECSSSRARIKVFPAYRFGESYEAQLTTDLLVRAVTVL